MTPEFGERGSIHADSLYTLDSFKKRLGMSDAALRSARRAGLKVHYKHGRGFISGQAWITYVTEPEPEPVKEPGLPTRSGT